MSVPALVTQVFEYLEQFFIHNKKCRTNLPTNPTPVTKCNYLNIAYVVKKIFSEIPSSCILSHKQRVNFVVVCLLTPLILPQINVREKSAGGID